MAPTVARPLGKVTLYAEDGTTVERHTIDAREMLATGGWSLTPPGTPPVTTLDPKPAPDPMPPKPVTAAEAEPVAELKVRRGRKAKD